jgi:hypothetical protein
MIVATAITKVTGLPAARDAAVAKRENLDLDANVLTRLTPDRMAGEAPGDGVLRSGARL